jgi:hypothetical protein
VVKSPALPGEECVSKPGYHGANRVRSLGKQSHSQSPQKAKYLGKNPTKEVKYLCNEKCKTLEKEIEEVTRGRLLHKVRKP